MPANYFLLSAPKHYQNSFLFTLRAWPPLPNQSGSTWLQVRLLIGVLDQMLPLKTPPPNLHRIRYKFLSAASKPQLALQPLFQPLCSLRFTLQQYPLLVPRTLPSPVFYTCFPVPEMLSPPLSTQMLCLL